MPVPEEVVVGVLRKERPAAPLTRDHPGHQGRTALVRPTQFETLPAEERDPFSSNVHVTHVRTCTGGWGYGSGEINILT